MDVQRDGKRVASSQDRRATGAHSDRGQTTIDFTIGISVFLGVVIVIFLFVPGLLSPFTAGSQEETVLADRVADQLVRSTLADPSEPFVLDTDCTRWFFNSGDDSPFDCRFDDTSGVPLTERIGLSDRQKLNITIVGNISATDQGSELLCWDTGNERLFEDDECGGGVTLAAGDEPPQSRDSSVTAKRVATLERWDVIVVVTMW